MWILLITVMAVTSPPNRNFQPSLLFQEFTSEEHCLAAKVRLEEGFGSEIGKLNKLLVDQTTSGEVRDYERIFFGLECLIK
jgi:hypothetical protein